MTVKNNPVLGNIKCNECQGQATVHAAKRGRGRFLYTRCTNCGTDQRTGAAFQTRIFGDTNWRDEVVTPPNLIIKNEEEAGEKINNEEQENAGDWSPEETEKDGQKNEGSSGFSWVVIGLGAIGAAIVGLNK